jgi:hypothetical protein
MTPVVVNDSFLTPVVMNESFITTLSRDTLGGC